MPIKTINNFISRYHIEKLSETERLELANKILSKIKTTGCLPNPIHYTVIYESIVKIDHSLGQQIEETINSGLYSNNIAEDIYRDLILKYLFAHLPSQQVEELLQNLLTQMDQWFAQTEIETQTIHAGITSMNEEEIPVKIKAALEQQVLPAINQMLSHTDEFKDEALEASEQIHALKTQLAQANEIAKTDELTKLPNRRAFNETAQELIKKTAEDNEYSFSMILIDIDFFKFINDEYGHLIGDSVLRYLANLLKKETKGKDFVGRYGGEEFVLLLPYTNYNNALLVAESLREKISKTTLTVKNAGKALKLNISCGVSTYTNADTIDSVFERADKALYSAKNNGRNQVKGEQDLS